MSRSRERYPFIERDARAGSASLAPLLPVTLRLGSQQVVVSGLIDTGAAVSVLPFGIGTRLGADWTSAVPVVLSGNLAGVESRVLVIEGVIGAFAPRRLAFAWAGTDAVPVLLGQVNFLMEFDITLSRSGGWFEVAEPTP